MQELSLCHLDWAVQQIKEESISTENRSCVRRTYRQRKYLPPLGDLRRVGELLELHEWAVADNPPLDQMDSKTVTVRG